MASEGNKGSPLLTLGLGIIAATIAKNIGVRIFNHNYLRGKVVLITGGTTGLGFLLAKEMVREEAKVAICARDTRELDRALERLEDMGADAIALECDVSDTAEVNECIDEVISHFGRIDVLVNNAGIIQVGAMESFSHEDFESAMDVMYWGIANTTFAVMDPMKRQGSGHIVNITSVGGKLSLPHLLPYSASKFAAVGFSEGITAELAKDGIHVTTIVPGLMRTGSFVNANFNKGDTKEFKLFSFMASAPGLTLSPERAARMIIDAVKDKKAYKVLGFQANAMIQMHNFFPNLSAKLFGVVNRFLPKSNEKSLESGKKIQANHRDQHFGFGKFADRSREKYQDLRPN